MRFGKDPHGATERCDEYVSGGHSDYRHNEDYGTQDRKGVYEIHQDHRGRVGDGADESPLFQRERITVDFVKTKIMDTGEIILYQSQDGATVVDVKLEQETVWLSLNQMAELFDRDKSVISRHISKIYSEKELDYDSTVAKKCNSSKRRHKGSRPQYRIL